MLPFSITYLPHAQVQTHCLISPSNLEVGCHFCHPTPTPLRFPFTHIHQTRIGIHQSESYFRWEACIPESCRFTPQRTKPVSTYSAKQLWFTLCLSAAMETAASCDFESTWCDFNLEIRSSYTIFFFFLILRKPGFQVQSRIRQHQYLNSLCSHRQLGQVIIFWMAEVSAFSVQA